MQIEISTTYTGRHDVSVTIAAVDRVRLYIYDRRGDGRYIDMRPAQALRIACRILWVAACCAAGRPYRELLGR